MTISKIAIIGDLHIGIHNNSSTFMDSCNRFFYDELIPKLQKEQVDGCVFLGDIYDSRVTIGQKAMESVRKLIETIKEEVCGTPLIIVGNHDLFYSSSNDIYSTRVFDNYANVVGDICMITYSCVYFTVVPWLSKNNNKFDVEKLSEFIETNKEKIDNRYFNCLSHIPVNGFPLQHNGRTDLGEIPEQLMFSNFKYTISGHYHTSSIKQGGLGNTIQYPGTPFELTRNDSGDSKHIMVCHFDTETNLLVKTEYLKSETPLRYTQVVFPDETFLTEEHIKGNIVDITTDYGATFDSVKLDEYRKKVESFGPAERPEIKIINKSKTEVVDEVNKQNFSSTKQLMVDYVSTTNFVEEKDKQLVMSRLDELYSLSGGD